MQDPQPMPWGALDRFQAHFVVKKIVNNDQDFSVKSILSTQGHFGGKKLVGVSWNGGKLAQALNADSSLNELISQQSLSDASILIEPTDTGVRIHSRWKNHLAFNISKEMFEIYDKIAGHIKSL